MSLYPPPSSPSRRCGSAGFNATGRLNQPIHIPYLISVHLITPASALFSGRHTFGHPYRGGITLEIMVEELLQAYGEVLAVASLYQIVILTIILKQPYRFSQTAQHHEI